MGKVVPLRAPDRRNTRSVSSVKSTDIPASDCKISQSPISTDLMELAKAHGFEAFAVLDITERRNGLVYPKMSFHGLDRDLAAQIGMVDDLTNCSVFLMLGETNIPFPFTMGLDCRTNERPDPRLLDNQLDALLNMYGLKGGYCVPVCAPNARRSVVMYFGIRQEHYSRYPTLVLDTIEAYDAIWRSSRTRSFREGMTLSAVELKCLEYLAQGMNKTEIGGALSLSEPAVSIYIKSINKKMAVKNAQEAVLKANSTGLL